MTTATKAKPATKAFEDVAAQTKVQVEGFVKAGQEQAVKQFEQTAAAAKEQVEKISAQLLKSYADLQELSKGNVDALVQSGTIASQGAQDLGREVVAYTQASLDKSITTGKSLLTAKSLKEVVDLQTEFFKSSFESFVSEATRIQDLSTRVTNEAIAPLSARVNVAVEKFSKPLAA